MVNWRRRGRSEVNSGDKRFQFENEFAESEEKLQIDRQKSKDDVMSMLESKDEFKRDEDEATVIGEESQVESDDEFEKDEDEVTVVGEESQLEIEDEITLTENDLIKSISSGSIYFDALGENNNER